MRREPDPYTGFRLTLLGAVFCLSGASALVYQVSWQRILLLQSGIGIYSVAMIVSAFMAGLGIGSYLGGLLSARVGRTRALRLFAALELGIGLFAIWSCWLYYDMLSAELAWLYADPWRAAAGHFLSLLLPTTMMGMSLPLLVRGTVRDPVTACRTIGYLYGINVIGAAAGALLAPWILMRFYGVEGAVRIGALGNIVAGVTALALGAGRDAGPEEAPGHAAARGGEPAASRPFALWLGLYALSGFCALSLEILWFRVVDVAVKSTAFTFGTVLSIYLLGFGLGGLIGGPLALRLRRPLKAFLTCQCLLLIYSAVALGLLVSLPPDWPVYRELVAFWTGYAEFPLGLDWDWRRLLLLYGLVPALLYGPPTVLMGLSFGILQRAVHDDVRTSGLKVGLLQTANIAGNVAGSLLTGLLFLNLVGTAGTFRILLGLGLVFAAVGMRSYGARRSFGAFAAALLLLLVLLPPGERVWLRLHGFVEGAALVEEDASAVIAVTPDDPRGLRYSVNGKGHSYLPFGGNHSELGALPALIHPAPRTVAIIGLGSGDTAWAASLRRETQRVSVFEIGAPAPSILARTAERVELPRLRRFLADPRIEIVVADGRNALLRSDERFDVIEADALRPHSGFSGNLYSVEFFQLCADRLEPGGLMVTWAPTPRIRLGFLQAFPHVLEFREWQILVGSGEPLDVDRATWMQRLDAPEVASYLGPEIARQIAEALGTARPMRPVRSIAIKPNFDLFPRDEFSTPLHR